MPFDAGMVVMFDGHSPILSRLSAVCRQGVEHFCQTGTAVNLYHYYGVIAIAYVARVEFTVGL